MKQPLLKFDRFSLFSHSTPLLREIHFEVLENQNIALVGRSGSGKSLLLAAAGYLLPFQTGWRIDGTIHYKDKDLFRLTETERRELRGKDIACVLQESMTCLNPSMKVGKQISEAQFYAQSHAKPVEEWLEIFKLDRKIAHAYPHELSGGMRQRISIAIALCTRAKLVLADEPTSALDKDSQQIVCDVLKNHCVQHGGTLLLVTHDMKLAESLSDKTIRIEHGRIKTTDS